MKHLVFYFFTLTSLFASSGFYFGSSSGYYDETFTTTEASSSSYMSRFNLGYGNTKTYKIELSLEYFNNQSKIFTASSIDQNDKDKFAFNIEVYKGYTLTNYILPYIKVGFGSGYLDIQRTLQKSLNFGTLNLGVGINVPLLESLDFITGYDYRYISYEKIDNVITTQQHKSNQGIFTFGFNYKF